MINARALSLRAFILLCVLAALCAMGCSSQFSYPTCPDGGYCALLPPDFPPWTDGYACVLPCECDPSGECGAPNTCPGPGCPDAGSENLCPQGWVCMPVEPCASQCTC